MLSTYNVLINTFACNSVKKFVLHNKIAGKTRSLMEPKFVSTLIRVGLLLYRIKNVAINDIPQMKQINGIIIQNILNLFRNLFLVAQLNCTYFDILVPRGSFICFKPCIVVVDENWSQVNDAALKNTIFLDILTVFFFTIAIFTETRMTIKLNMK